MRAATQAFAKQASRMRKEKSKSRRVDTEANDAEQWQAEGYAAEEEKRAAVREAAHGTS